MKIKKGRLLLNLSIVASLLVLVATEYRLSQVGRGLDLIRPKLPFGISLKYDLQNGYKFLEEGFIHIINEHSAFRQDTVRKILAYSVTENDLFVATRTTKGSDLYLKISFLGSLPNGNQYEVKDYKVDGTEDWIVMLDEETAYQYLAIRNLSLIVALLLVCVRVVLLLIG